MEMSILLWLAAFLPILVLIVVLVKFKWGGDEAAVVGLVASILIAFLVYGGKVDGIALAVGKGIWNALSIIIVVFPALAIYEVSRESGAFAVFKSGMQSFTPNKVLQVLTVGWIFVGFLQGITGFGVPVAVGAPLLISLGVRPLNAVLITLLGQAWGNTFGTLAIAWDGLVAQVNLSDPAALKSTILWSTAILGVVNLLAGLVITWLAGGVKGLRRNLLTVLSLAALQGVGQMWLALFNPMLSNFVMASISLAAVFVIGRLPYYQEPVGLDDDLSEPAVEPVHHQCMNIHQAFIPYYFLVLNAMIVLLNKELKDYLGQWKVGLPFAQKMTDLGFVAKGTPFYSPITPLIHSGAFLLAAAVIGYISYQWLGCIRPGGLSRIIKNSWSKTIPSAIAVIGLIAMSKVMDETGQTSVLAQGVASVTGSAYPILSPFIGFLGTFMTSSNLSSNILFGSFQETVAALLNVDKAPILAAQTVGGTIGSIIAPSKVLLGTTTAGILGQEGEIIRRFLTGSMLLCAAIGITILLAIRIGG